MADERELPQHEAPDDDFGGFLGRRLRSYQSGVLGLKSLNDVPVSGAATEQGANLVNRSAEFAGSLQSLLSYRAASAVPAPPPVSREFDAAPSAPSMPQSQESSAAEETDSTPAPTGPIAFGSETWFSRMAQRIAATEQLQRQSAPVVTGPSAAAIEAALGIDQQSPRPRPDGSVRRRSVVQEMSGAGVEFSQDWSAPRIAAPSEQPEETAAEEAPEPPAPAMSESTAAALARAESVSESSSAPKIGPALVQRRPRGRRPTAPAADAPVQRLPDPELATLAPAAAPTAAPDSPVPSVNTEQPQVSAVTPATEQSVRRSVVAAPQQRRDEPDEGREGVRRIVPTTPRPPTGASPTLTPPAVPATAEEVAPVQDQAAAPSPVIDAPPVMDSSSPETDNGSAQTSSTDPGPIQRLAVAAEPPAAPARAEDPEIRPSPQASESPAVEPAGTVVSAGDVAAPIEPMQVQVEATEAQAPSSTSPAPASATVAPPAEGRAAEAAPAVAPTPSPAAEPSIRRLVEAAPQAVTPASSNETPAPQTPLRGRTGDSRPENAGEPATAVPPAPAAASVMGQGPAPTATNVGSAAAPAAAVQREAAGTTEAAIAAAETVAVPSQSMASDQRASAPEAAVQRLEDVSNTVEAPREAVIVSAPAPEPGMPAAALELPGAPTGGESTASGLTTGTAPIGAASNSPIQRLADPAPEVANADQPAVVSSAPAAGQTGPAPSTPRGEEPARPEGISGATAPGGQPAGSPSVEPGAAPEIRRTVQAQAQAAVGGPESPEELLAAPPSASTPDREAPADTVSASEPAQSPAAVPSAAPIARTADESDAAAEVTDPDTSSSPVTDSAAPPVVQRVSAEPPATLAVDDAGTIPPPTRAERTGDTSEGIQRATVAPTGQTPPEAVSSGGTSSAARTPTTSTPSAGAAAAAAPSAPIQRLADSPGASSAAGPASTSGPSASAPEAPGGRTSNPQRADTGPELPAAASVGSPEAHAAIGWPPEMISAASSSAPEVAAAGSGSETRPVVLAESASAAFEPGEELRLPAAANATPSVSASGPLQRSADPAAAPESRTAAAAAPETVAERFTAPITATGASSASAPVAAPVGGSDIGTTAPPVRRSVEADPPGVAPSAPESLTAAPSAAIAEPAAVPTVPDVVRRRVDAPAETTTGAGEAAGGGASPLPSLVSRVPATAASAASSAAPTPAAVPSAAAAPRERVFALPTASETMNVPEAPPLLSQPAPAQPVQRRFEPQVPATPSMAQSALPPQPPLFQPVSAGPAAGAPPPVLRAAEPVEMPLAPVQREVAVPAGPATGEIQRVGGETQNSSGNQEVKSSAEYDRLAEEMWPRIRRKLRIERERERGLPY